MLFRDAIRTHIWPTKNASTTKNKDQILTSEVQADFRIIKCNIAY